MPEQQSALMRLYRHLTGHPEIIIGLILLLSIYTRYTITYFGNPERLVIPDQYYQGPVRGNDWRMTVMDQADRVIAGIKPDLSMGYGYGFTLPAVAAMSAVRSAGYCAPASTGSCTYWGYLLFVSSALFLQAGLMLTAVKRPEALKIAILFFAVFLLGIPGARGIETGNLDILLSAIVGFALIGSLRSPGRPRLTSLITGLVFGWLINIKLFIGALLPAVVFAVPQPAFAVAGILIGHVLVNTLPALFGIMPDYLFPLSTSLYALAPMSEALFRGYPHGNNTLLGTAAGMVGALGFSGTRTGNFFTRAFALLLGIAVFVPPAAYLYRGISRNAGSIRGIRADFLRTAGRGAGLLRRNRENTAILFSAAGVAAMNLIPAMAYDYRLYYALPVIYLMLNRFAPGSDGLRLTYLTVYLFLLRTVWILKGRTMNIFLYAFFVMILLTAVRAYLPADHTGKKRGHP
ncbi:hypothetical protein A2Z33_04650 [Candidatus Gottesmanbacteria bacterium RBG_16_52_11]|uniref:Uncharacterized protein n=1 Tax=Candidatus Gottesmanbacteria bacterium RBG_16_52_11 TaxID=1798374 RepID=A0A1F5YU98_9BACT|nr:MAG: hypothetical protein A2Z33_04650 [Candidatus Gottesmanbacteria bacterium RBG_16_52_11]